MCNSNHLHQSGHTLFFTIERHILWRGLTVLSSPLYRKHSAYLGTGGLELTPLWCPTIRLPQRGGAKNCNRKTHYRQISTTSFESATPMDSLTPAWRRYHLVHVFLGLLSLAYMCTFANISNQLQVCISQWCRVWYFCLCFCNECMFYVSNAHRG